MAMAITFCAVCFFKEHSGVRAWLLYYVMACIAITCHTSAIIALIIPLFIYLPLNRTTSLCLIIASIIIGFFPLQHFLQSYNLFLISDTYGHYLDEYSSVGVTGTRLLMNGYIVYVIFCKPKAMDCFDKLMIMGICLQNAFPYPIAIRFFSYLILFSIISIPNRYSCNRNKLFLYVTLLYGVIKFFVFLNTNVAGVVPYSFG